jgi:hypothetical protein
MEIPIRDGHVWCPEVKIEEPATMNELPASTHSSDYPGRSRADLLPLDDEANPTRPSKQARRRAFLHEAAIITVGVVICVVAICIIVERTQL